MTATPSLSPSPDLPPEIADRLRAIKERQAQIEASKATRAAADALPPTPEELLRAEEEKLARMEREEADEKAWRELRAKHGKGKVARIPTPLGDIILRARTMAEADSDHKRIVAAREGGVSETVARETILEKVVYPTQDKARKILECAHGYWVDIINARDALDRMECEDLAGKA